MCCLSRVPFDWLRMLTLMERQAGLAEFLGAQLAMFGMSWAQRCAAVVAQGFCGATTRCTELILHPSNLNDSAQEIAHVSQKLYHCGLMLHVRHFRNSFHA
jgi:hypothetical protein